MNDEADLLAMIRAHPDDDAPRLIYADWLDEHDQPERAEFIRVQCRMAELERPHDSDFDRFVRATKPFFRKQPYAWPIWANAYWELQERNSALFEQHAASWCGDFHDICQDSSAMCRLEWRRGFAERITFAADTKVLPAEFILKSAPLAQELVLYGPLPLAWPHATTDIFQAFRHVHFAGWLRETNTIGLAENPHFQHIETLTVWLGQHDAPSIIMPLLRSPHVRKLVLVVWQHAGIAEDQTKFLQLLLPKTHPEITVDVQRPAGRCYPLNGSHIRGRLYSGVFADGRIVLVAGGIEPVFHFFNSAGELTDTETVNLRGPLTELLLDPQDTYYEWELLDWLHRERGYQRSPILVRAFSSQLADLHIVCPGEHADEIANPDGHYDDANIINVCERLLEYWWRGGNFMVRRNGDKLAGPDGTIHTY